MVSDRTEMTTEETTETTAEAFPFDEFDALDEVDVTLGNEYVNYHGALQHTSNTSQAYQYAKKKRQLRQKRATAFWKLG